MSDNNKKEWVLHILVLGAAGMVGRKLTERLLRDGRLGKRDITRMTCRTWSRRQSPPMRDFRSTP